MTPTEHFERELDEMLEGYAEYSAFPTLQKLCDLTTRLNNRSCNFEWIKPWTWLEQIQQYNKDNWNTNLQKKIIFNGKKIYLCIQLLCFSKLKLNKNLTFLKWMKLALPKDAWDGNGISRKVASGMS